LEPVRKQAKEDGRKMERPGNGMEDSKKKRGDRGEQTHAKPPPPHQVTWGQVTGTLPPPPPAEKGGGPR
jgi:hypothetical protein